MSVADAAAVMGVSKDYIRVGLQRGLLPFGTAVKMSNRYTYFISSRKLFEYIGVKDYEEITSFYAERSIKDECREITKAGKHCKTYS